MKKLFKPSSEELLMLRTIADFQFRYPGIGQVLIPDNVLVEKSPNTLKIRGIYLDGKLIAALRVNDNRLVLHCTGGRLIWNKIPKPRFRVYVVNEVRDFISKGLNVFSRHVIDVDPEIRAGDEVIVVDENDNLLAVGRARLSAYEMLHFIRGEAVRIREGCIEC